MIALQPLDDRVRRLREEFDRSFAATVADDRALHEDFLAIRIAGDRYALRLAEVASLHADRALVRAPSLLPELVGIAGFRGALTPVYDLAALLGYPALAGTKWLVVAEWPSPIAFAFETFDAHLRVAVDRVSLNSDAGTALHGAVHDGRSTLALLHLPSLVEGIAQRIKALGPSQER
jgi:chemotaxis signal transduction protein